MAFRTLRISNRGQLKKFGLFSTATRCATGIYEQHLVKLETGMLRHIGHHIRAMNIDILSTLTMQDVCGYREVAKVNMGELGAASRRRRESINAELIDRYEQCIGSGTSQCHKNMSVTCQMLAFSCFLCIVTISKPESHKCLVDTLVGVLLLKKLSNGVEPREWLTSGFHSGRWLSTY